MGTNKKFSLNGFMETIKQEYPDSFSLHADGSISCRTDPDTYYAPEELDTSSVPFYDIGFALYLIKSKNGKHKGTMMQSIDE